MSQKQAKRRRVVVIGAGAAGLSAAAFAARAGGAVTLLEAISQPGGRARTRSEGAFRFNMGPHALYRKGPAEAVLNELGVRPSGSPPDISRSLGWWEGRLHKLPGGPLSLLTTTLLGPRDKLSLGKELASLPKLDPAPWNGRSLRDFIDTTFATAPLRSVFEALVRLSTYCNAPEHLSAGMAIAQVQAALSNGVIYLDGGWQPMIDSIQNRCLEAGVEIRTGARVRSLENNGVWKIRLAGDVSLEADAVVLAMGPGEANALFDGGTPFLAEQDARSLPVRAACLDLGLSRLPNPKRPFALGIDTPTYHSLHSAASGLAPAGAATFQLARYLAPDEKPERAQVQQQLEDQFDVLQSGWREHVETSKLLLDVRVAHAVPTAESGGLPGRPRIDALRGERPGVWLAGDWVGPEGWLVDACFASGAAAGRAAAMETGAEG